MTYKSAKFILFGILLGIAASAAAEKAAEQAPAGPVKRFSPLAEDGIHDPANPKLVVKQEPAGAFQGLPRDKSGDPDWMQSLTDGFIEPRTGLTGSEKMGSIDLDIVMKNTASMQYVRFRHATHTQWLTCSNCHTAIFQPQQGGNFITMAAIIEGQYCGVCHGKVAFNPLTNCKRCHSVEENTRRLR